MARRRRSSSSRSRIAKPRALALVTRSSSLLPATYAHSISSVRSAADVALTAMSQKAERERRQKEEELLGKYYTSKSEVEARMLDTEAAAQLFRISEESKRQANNLIANYHLNRGRAAANQALMQGVFSPNVADYNTVVRNTLDAYEGGTAFLAPYRRQIGAPGAPAAGRGPEPIVDNYWGRV